MIHIKYCRRCKKPFDMGDYEICPECRGERMEKERQEELKDGR